MAGIAPASLIAEVSIAAVSTGNGNTTIGNKPPAPPTGAGSDASPTPTAGPTGTPTAAPTVSPTTAPTSAPTAAPTPAPTSVPRSPVLKPSTVDADNSAFVGAAASNTSRLTLELAAGDAALAQKLKVAPGVEIRSTGKLTLASDWNLAPTASTRVGEAPVVTLRAGGELVIANSLSDGFAAAAGATDKRAITAGGLAQSGSAASFRLIGGADLGAADPLAVHAGSLAGITVGRAAASSTAAPPVVFVRSTTGSISMAAAGDINLGALDAAGRNGQVRIYTTGEAVDASGTPGLERIGIRAADQLIRNTSGALGPFFENAGDITLNAGRDVLGMPSTIYPSSGAPSSVQYVSDWWWRQTNPTTVDHGVALWSRYDLFAQGIASFGGGDIKVRAGRDVVDLDVSTPASGYAVQAKGDLAAQQRWFAGGDLTVSAGRDVVGGLFNAGGATASLAAGGAIGGSSAQARSYASPQLFYLDTAWTVGAGGNLQLGALSNMAAMAGAKQGIDNGPRSDTIAGLAPHSSAELLSIAGDVSLADSRPASVSGSKPGTGAAVMPDELSVAAPGGAIMAATLAQRPVGASSLQLLAQDRITLDAFQIAASLPETANWPVPQTQAELGDFFNVYKGLWASTAMGLDASGRSPVRIVSADADVLLGQLSSFSARPLRLVAGTDLLLGPVQLQHSDANELSLLQAGRDVRVGSVVGGVRLAGPGDLLVSAGRDIDLGRGTGFVSVGNLDNSRLLPNGGANITMLAGIKLADLAPAVAGQYQLVGAGLQNFPAELAVQLAALANGGSLLTPAQMAEAVKAFAALSPQTQRDRVRALVGDALFSSATEAYLQRAVALAEANSEAATAAVAAGRIAGSTRDAQRPPVPGSELLAGAPQLISVDASKDQHEAAQASVRAALRESLAATMPASLGAALAAKAETLDAATRRALIQAVSPYSDALTRFVNTRTASSLDAAAAAQAFQQLPAEQQALFLNQVLMAELKTAGRAALGSERVAYLRGYEALDALYPAQGRDGNIVLSNSQVKTAQGGNISFAAPAGTLNVGDLAGGGTAKAASDLGIVTVAGGHISAAVLNSVEVNQSRIFSLSLGDVLLWASLGNLDAGRGAKTVLGTPPPVYSINANGQFVVDTSGAFSGSGIAVLDAASTLDLYAALGEINAGDAGIKTAGNAFLGATRLVGADNVAVGGVVKGASLTGETSAGALSVPLPSSATAAGKREMQSADDDEEKRRKRRTRRNLFLDFLGFGQGD